MKANSSSDDVIRRFASKGIFPYQMAFTLLIPLRNLFLSPQKLIKRLSLEPNHRVLEVGPGPGYFSVPIAMFLKQGQLVLADIQTEMLVLAKRRLQRRRIDNVEYYHCNGNSFSFPDQVFDRIFLVTVLGEVENKEVYMSEFYRMLSPNGMLSISELAGDPDRLESNQVIALALKAGFNEFVQYGSSRNYTLNCLKM